MENQNEKGPAVEFVYLKTNDEVKFHAGWDETLQSVWEMAYGKLEETKLGGDEVECRSGTSLMPYLAFTLAQLRDQQICASRKFQIRSETGGA